MDTELEKIEKLIRANGEYRERFSIGLMDMVDVHVKPLAKTIQQLVLEARITELKEQFLNIKAKTVYGIQIQEYVKERIADLTKQFEELKK